MKEILYDWGGFNVWLFRAINNARGEYLDKFMLLGTQLSDHANFPLYLALTALFAVIMTANARRISSTSWLVVIAVFSTAYLLDGLFIGALKPLLDYPRPPLALTAVHIVGRAEYHHSLPSGHSSFAMLCVASLWPVLTRRIKVIGIFLVLWVGVSRISLGAHFPADVLAGFLSSLLIVLLVYKVVQLLMRIKLH
jgi:membrane-associated phospholipid phosphatase